VEVWTDAGSASAARRWLGHRDVGYRRQSDGDLGARIRAAFTRAFDRGAQQVVVIGSDCPRLSATHLRQALQLLSDVGLVLGPALDGGYYLIGINRESAARALPALFADVPWGSADVLARTLEAAESAHLGFMLLEPLPDVDRPEDLEDAWAALARTHISADASVCVVIPALNDEALVAAAVSSAQAGGAAEILVVDGGSHDATRAVAAAAGARVLDSSVGRARQMNAGASVATSDVLLFLHADTVLPPGACVLATRTLTDPRTVAGGFAFDVPAKARHSALISAVGRLRGSLGGLPWGDQGLFLARDTFRALGGFPVQQTMEDYEFVRRLARFGRVTTLPERAITSARSWEDHGLVAPTLVNLAAITMYELGADSESVAAWRRRIAR